MRGLFCERLRNSERRGEEGQKEKFSFLKESKKNKQKKKVLPSLPVLQISLSIEVKGSLQYSLMPSLLPFPFFKISSFSLYFSIFASLCTF
jgi:hypothetical protein